MTSTVLTQVYIVLADGKLWSLEDLMLELGVSSHQIQQALDEDNRRFIRHLDLAKPKLGHIRTYYKKRG